MGLFDIKFKSFRLTLWFVSSISAYERFAAKRAPWCVPGGSKAPAITLFQKTLLFYTMDGQTPLFYESHVTDRRGQSHGFTSMFPLGTLYQLTLEWKQGPAILRHHFQFSTAVEEEQFFVYSHTAYIEHANKTGEQIKPSTIPAYIFPVGTSYFKNFIKFEPESKYSYNYMGVDNSLSDEPGEVKDAPSKDEYISKESTFQSHSFNSGQFSVMSYNIWNMNSKPATSNSYTKRMNRVKNVLLGARPDVVCIQEVRYAEGMGGDMGPAQVATVADWLQEYQFVYEPAQMQPNTIQDGRTEEGVAIFSRYPIVHTQTYMLFINRSNSADTHQRILLRADIYIPITGVVHVLTTHLSLSHEAREASVRQILEIVSQLPGPAVFAGDLNAEPHEPAMTYLRGFRSQETKFQDIWLHSYPEDKGFTFNALEPNLTKRCEESQRKVDAGLRRREAMKKITPPAIAPIPMELTRVSITLIFFRWATVVFFRSIVSACTICSTFSSTVRFSSSGGGSARNVHSCWHRQVHVLFPTSGVVVSAAVVTLVVIVTSEMTIVGASSDVMPTVVGVTSVVVSEEMHFVSVTLGLESTVDT
ncbi:hypothetical protein MAR_014936, partial [Mya arenaria]